MTKTIDELIDASSFGTPRAKRLRELGGKLRLTPAEVREAEVLADQEFYASPVRLIHKEVARHKRETPSAAFDHDDYETGYLHGLIKALDLLRGVDEP